MTLVLTVLIYAYFFVFFSLVIYKFISIAKGKSNQPLLGQILLVFSFVMMFLIFASFHSERVVNVYSFSSHVINGQLHVAINVLWESIFEKIALLGALLSTFVLVFGVAGIFSRKSCNKA